ncbi:MAG: outer membrane beta-barrel protein [Bacteroidota bacterium]|nr:outer membrane beta-barrel protein [Bacteroidota bacterium]
MMKKSVLLLAILIFTLGVVAQENKTDVDTMKKELNEKKADTAKILLKRKTVKIIEDEDEGETQIFVKKHNRGDWEFLGDDNNFFSSSRFRGSWSGFSMGLSNFVDKDFSISRSGNNEFMDLNTGKSWNMNINFAQYSVNLVNNKFGLVTGLGLEFNFYRFDSDNSIQKDVDGVIINRDLPDTWNIQKSKFSTTYATLPILFEVHTSSYQNKGIVFAAGVIGGAKLGSNTKVVYKENSDKKKEKTRDDFNLNPFRYGLTARLGVGDVLVYGTYYLNPLFESGKYSGSEDLYPISVGIAFSFE